VIRIEAASVSVGVLRQPRFFSPDLRALADEELMALVLDGEAARSR